MYLGTIHPGIDLRKYSHFQNRLLGSPDLSTSSCLREPIRNDCLSKNIHLHKKTEMHSHEAPMSRLFSISMSCLPIAAFSLVTARSW